MKTIKITIVIFAAILASLVVSSGISQKVSADAASDCESVVPRGAGPTGYTRADLLNACIYGYDHGDGTGKCVSQYSATTLQSYCQNGWHAGGEKGPGGNPASNPTNPHGTCTTDGAQGKDGLGICATGADDPHYHGNKCGSVTTTILNCGSNYQGTGKDGLDNSGLMGIVVFILNIVTGSVIIAGVGALAWGGFQYASAQGNAQQVQQAISTIRNTIIGVVVFILFVALVEFLSPAKVFGP